MLVSNWLVNVSNATTLFVKSDTAVVTDANPVVIGAKADTIAKV